MKFKTRDELLAYTQGIVGKKFKDIDTKNLLNTFKNDKGILGKIVETGFYGYDLNNTPKADFEELGIELKVTGFKKNKNGTISAKERLVLGNIDYCELVNEEYEFSKLIFKNKTLLIIWYEYDDSLKKEYGEFEIKYFQVYDMSIDEEVFKNDFNIIRDKVIEGKAHLLSEGDTSYLGACTKGNKGSKPAKQPNTIYKETAKHRAFSLKNGYMTGVLRAMDTDEFTHSKFKSAKSYIYDKLKPYFGLTQREIWDAVGNKELLLDVKVPNNISKMISDRIIGKDKDLGLIDDIFNKVTYFIKNTSVDEENYPMERLTFRNLFLSEFELDWCDSDWNKYFEEVTLIVILYQGKINGKRLKNGDRILKDIVSISFSSDDLKSFMHTYKMVQDTIKMKDISKLPYPNSYSNQCLEISPRGNGGDRCYESFFDKDCTKTCFVFNKKFVSTKINNEINNY